LALIIIENFGVLLLQNIFNTNNKLIVA